MKLSSRLVFVGLLGIGLSTYSCANGDTVSGMTGEGGSGTGQGGSTGNGGSGSPTGGTTGAGGTVSHTGGTTGTGGTVSHTGGTTGTGGTVSHTGGTTGTGGIITTGTGGTTGAGGSGAVSCAPSFQPTTGGWVTAPATGTVGCFHGYAYTFTETPNCGSSISPKDFSTCSTTCALSSSGTVAIAASPDYCGVVGMGFAINQAQGATSGSTLVPQGNGITVAFTESAGTLPFRVQLRDNTTGTSYCYQVTGGSPAMIPYGSFNSKCYDTPIDGVAYAKQPITDIQILIAGGAAATPFTMALTSVQEY